MPERWDCGDGDKEGKKREEMNRWFWAFGSGGRMCLGSHFVLHGMSLFPVILSLFRFLCFPIQSLSVREVYFPQEADLMVMGAEMKLVVASVYSNYRTEIAEVGDMRQSDEYIAVPRGERCVLRFVRV